MCKYIAEHLWQASCVCTQLQCAAAGHLRRPCMCCSALTAHVVLGALVGGQQLPLRIKQELEHGVVVAHLRQPQLLRFVLRSNLSCLHAIAVAVDAQLQLPQAAACMRYATTAAAAALQQCRTAGHVGHQQAAWVLLVHLLLAHSVQD